ncbi:hypothetical protein C4D60_Mb11t20550 [Musa balbisiana]|uniref:Uncharacterized protein n=1 Tax=Musa balbisiana TaxID=52838 RepID=A0A4S8J5S9_MUSBA|nr:hypothetical protein C4D60_Mb11t20550 [Musa balbisiana]
MACNHHIEVEDESEMKEKRDWSGRLPRLSKGSEGEDEVARCSRCGQPLDDSDQVMSPSSMASAERGRRPDRALETEGSHAAPAECRLVVRVPGGSGPISLNKEEVKACRDLMIGFPCGHLRVELPAAFSDMQADAAGACDDLSPFANWKIASPDYDQEKMKARIKLWAQAVVLMSAMKSPR